MKKIFGIALIALLGLALPSVAQNNKQENKSGVKKGVKKAWAGTKKGAKAAGNKTAEVASKGKAKVVDKKSNTWIGPEGQTIYITNDSRYYWVNGHGKRIFVSKAALRARQ